MWKSTKSHHGNGPNIDYEKTTTAEKIKHSIFYFQILSNGFALTVMFFVFTLIGLMSACLRILYKELQY